MTAYVCDTPYRNEFFLWADTSDEAVGVLYAVGGDETQRRADLNAWETYMLTPEQFADACGLGITVTDKWGPAIWCAERDGAAERLRRLLDARARG